MGSLILKDLTKDFGVVRILKAVSLGLKSGKIHALVGANGAGKSTLINTLSGMFNDYGGEILYDSAPVSIKNIEESKRLGIRTVHQEFDVSLFPSLSVLENVVLQTRDKQVSSAWWFPPRGAKDWVIKRLSKVGFTEFPFLDEPISTLRPADRQKVAIAIAMDEDTKYLILDEPTASLPLDDAANLLQLLKTLRNQGVGILYVSHHLNEVYEISDEVSVLRDGTLVDHFDIPAERDIEALRNRTVKAMLNREYSSMYPVHENVFMDDSNSPIPLLEVQDMRTATGVSNVNLKLYPGEIVAITGLVGGGKTEFLRALFGMDSVVSGKLFWKGQQVNWGNSRSMIARGVGFVPEDRHNLGLHLEDSVIRNISLPSLRQLSGTLGWLSKPKELQLSRELKDAVGLVASNLEMPVGRLSGGNQQKVVLAKWLKLANSALFLDEPTKGVDIGARAGIYQILRQLTEKGLAILLATSEIDEALGLADRVVVMRRGTIVFEADNQNLDADSVMIQATTGTGGIIHG